MPMIHVNGADLHYEERGSGEETIVFAHGFLFSGRMYEAQVAALEERYRCITFDHRGQGQSEVTKSGYEIDSITDDAQSLIEALDCAPCHFVGLSMGGFVGLRLAIRSPHLLRTLILLETSADKENEQAASQYKLLGFVARWFGTRVVMSRIMPIMFGQKFLNDPSREDERKAWRDFLIARNRIGVSRTLQGVVTREGVAGQLEQIKAPTLIIIGDQDAVYSLEVAQGMHEKISDSRLVVIPGAGHTSTIEEPAAVYAAVNSFLADQGVREDGR